MQVSQINFGLAKKTVVSARQSPLTSLHTSQTISQASLNQGTILLPQAAIQSKIEKELQNFLISFFKSQTQAIIALNKLTSIKTISIKNQFSEIISSYYKNTKSIELGSFISEIQKKIVTLNLVQPIISQTSEEIFNLNIIIRLVNDHKIINQFLIANNDLRSTYSNLMTAQGLQMIERIQQKNQQILNMKVLNKNSQVFRRPLQSFANPQEYSRLSLQLNAKNKQLQDLNRILANRQKEFNQLNLQIKQQINTQKSIQSQRINKLIEQNTKLQQKIEAMRISQNAIENQKNQLINSLKVAQFELQTNKSIYMRAVELLQKDKKQLQIQNNLLSNKSRQIQQQMLAIKDTFQNHKKSSLQYSNQKILKQQISQLRKQIKVKQDQLAILSREKSELNLKIHNFQNQLYELHQKNKYLQTLNKQKSQITKSTDALLLQNQRLIQISQQKQRNLKELLIQLQRLNLLNLSNIQLFYKRQAELELVIRNKDEEIKNMTQYINFIQQEKSNLQFFKDQKINSLQVELQKFKSQANTLKDSSTISQNNHLREKIKEYQSMINVLRQDLTNKQAQVSNNISTSEILKKHNLQLQQKIIEMQRQNNILQDKIKNIKDQYKQKDLSNQRLNISQNNFKQNTKDYQSIIKKLSEQIKVNESNIIFQRSQCSKIKDSNNQLTLAIKKYEDSNRNQQNTIKQLTERINKTETSLKQISAKYEVMNKQKLSIEQKYSRLMADRESRENILKQREQEILYLNEQLQKLSNINTEIIEQNQQLTINIDQLLQQNKKLIKNNHQNSNGFKQKLNEQIKAVQAKQPEQNKQLFSSQNNLKQQQTLIYKLQEELQSANNQIKILQINNLQLKAQIENLKIQSKSQIKDLIQQKQKLSLEISKERFSQSRRRQIQQYKQQIQGLKRQNLGFRQSLANWQAPNSNSKDKIDSLLVNNLFQGIVIQGLLPYKKYLKQVIQNHFGYKIIRTRLVYSFDTINKVNFHKYVDGVTNLLLIVKMANGTYTAGFSEGKFDSKEPSKKDGIIISLTNEKYFTLVKPNTRAITYDDFYIIFGNSELRLKCLENRLFSNFGISNGYYNSRGQKVSVLLGGLPTERQVQLQHYEFYEVFFDYGW